MKHPIIPTLRYGNYPKSTFPSLVLPQLQFDYMQLFINILMILIPICEWADYGFEICNIAFITVTRFH